MLMERWKQFSAEDKMMSSNRVVDTKCEPTKWRVLTKLLDLD
jgi:hypothetical protein